MYFQRCLNRRSFLAPLPCFGRSDLPLFGLTQRSIRSSGCFLPIDLPLGIASFSALVLQKVRSERGPPLRCHQSKEPGTFLVAKLLYDIPDAILFGLADMRPL